MNGKPHTLSLEEKPLIEAMQRGYLESVTLWEELPRQPTMPPARGMVAPILYNMPEKGVEISLNSTWKDKCPRQKGDLIPLFDTFNTNCGEAEVIRINRLEKRDLKWGLIFEVGKVGWKPKPI